MLKKEIELMLFSLWMLSDTDIFICLFFFFSFGTSLILNEILHQSKSFKGELDDSDQRLPLHSLHLHNETSL